jgi:hypothetical protein
MERDPAVRFVAGPTHGGTMMAAPSALVASSRSRPHSPTGLPAVSRSRRWRAAWPVTVSWALGAVLVAATLYGLLVGDAYRIDRDLEMASLGQDVLTLAVVPLLIWAGHRSRAGSLRGHLLWLSVLAYVAYAYAVYLIGVPHNDAFLLYAAALGLSVAALLDGLVRINVAATASAFAGLPRRGVGWLLLVTGTAFALLWLSDIVPAIPAAAPPRTLGPGGVPFAVFVLDLSLVLPAVVASGVMLLRPPGRSGARGGGACQDRHPRPCHGGGGGRPARRRPGPRPGDHVAVRGADRGLRQCWRAARGASGRPPRAGCDRRCGIAERSGR